MGKTMGVYDSKLIAEKLRKVRKIGDEQMFTLEKFKELMEEHAKFEDPVDEIPEYEKDNKILYNLKISQSAYINGGYKVTRVPGGWIYDRDKTSVFVPFVLETNEDNIQL